MIRKITSLQWLSWPAILVIGSQCIAGIMVRLAFISWESSDYTFFISGWYDYLAMHGRFHALADAFSNYTPMYLYMLSIASLLPIGKLLAIKSISFLFDGALAILVATFAHQAIQKKHVVVAAFAGVFLLPTVITNSAIWGQSDVIYTFFIVAFLIAMYFKKPWLAMMLFGLAFAIKFQAVFIAPLTLVLWVKDWIRFKHLLAIPVMFFATLVPSLIAGRPMMDLLLIYARQAATYSDLTLNAASIYQWLPSQPAHQLALAGILLCLSVTGTLVYLLRRNIHHFAPEHIIKIGFLFTLVVPFLLPHMHERYFFMADIIAVLYALLSPRMFILPIAMQVVSFFSYMPFLFNTNPPVSFAYLSFTVLTLILVVLLDIFAPRRLQHSTP